MQRTKYAEFKDAAVDLRGIVKVSSWRGGYVV
jgi:hypothetical protein